MRISKRLMLTSILIAAFIVMIALAGCGNGQDTNLDSSLSSSKESSQESIKESTRGTEIENISFTDMAGRPVSMIEPAAKIVALTAADCEIIYEIGAGDLLVGRGEYCNYPEEVMSVPAVQSGNETNIEQIIALEPDVIVMSIMAQSKEQVAALEEAGITVAVSDAQSINGIYEAISMLGTITGKTENAEELTANMKKEIQDISEKAMKLKPDETRSVYFEVSPLEWGLWAAGNHTFMNEAAELIGLENAFSDVEQWAEVSQEQVIERNPDYIITVAMYFGEGPLPEEEIMSREGWQNISAVARKNVFTANSDELARPGPRFIDGIRSLYEFVYE